MAARLAASLAGALRLPRPRPRQGHDAGRDPAAPPRPRGAQRRAGAAAERAAARRQRLQLARRGHRARARQRPAQRRTRRGGDRPPARTLRRLAPARALRANCCSPASATRAAASASTTRPIRSERRLLEALHLATAVDSAADRAPTPPRAAWPGRRSAPRYRRPHARAIEALSPQPTDHARSRLEAVASITAGKADRRESRRPWRTPAP